MRREREREMERMRGVGVEGALRAHRILKESEHADVKENMVRLETPRGTSCMRDEIRQGLNSV